MNHENTKFRKHEIYIISFSCFNPFVLSWFIDIFWFPDKSGLTLSCYRLVRDM